MPIIGRNARRSNSPVSTIPAGWRAVGKTGFKKDCLAYIEKVWTDMRPLSLRCHMEAEAAGAQASESAAS